MSKYAIKFSKSGYIKYTSHLDMLRLFKRMIKRCNIRLKYSQGFNPHPKLGFAQPLSLGYESVAEYLEMETAEHYRSHEIQERLSSVLPEGIRIEGVAELPDSAKPLAATCYEAQYTIAIPVPESFAGREKELSDGYMAQKKIITLKKQKKSKELKEVDIRGKIRSLSVVHVPGIYIMDLTCDCGSDSNLGPELVISSFMKYAAIDTPRSEIDVMRKAMRFSNLT